MLYRRERKKEAKKEREPGIIKSFSFDLLLLTATERSSAVLARDVLFDEQNLEKYPVAERCAFRIRFRANVFNTCLRPYQKLRSNK